MYEGIPQIVHPDRGRRSSFSRSSPASTRLSLTEGLALGSLKRAIRAGADEIA